MLLLNTFGDLWMRLNVLMLQGNTVPELAP